MKVKIGLSSKFLTEEENDLFFHKPIEIEWDLPFLPSKGDSIEISNYTKNTYNIKIDELIWSVDYIYYSKEKGMTVPMVWLEGT